MTPCAFCRTPFRPTRNGHRYCSPTCQGRAANARFKAKRGIPLSTYYHRMYGPYGRTK